MVMVAVFLFVSQGQRGVNGTDGMDGVSGSRGATGDIVSLLASQVTYAPSPPPPPSISASPLFSLLTSLLSSLHFPPSMHFSLCNLSCTYLLNISTLSSSSPTSLPLTYAHREMKVQLGHQDCQDLRGQPVSL